MIKKIEILFIFYNTTKFIAINLNNNFVKSLLIHNKLIHTNKHKPITFTVKNKKNFDIEIRNNEIRYAD